MPTQQANANHDAKMPWYAREFYLKWQGVGAIISGILGHAVNAPPERLLLGRGERIFAAFVVALIIAAYSRARRPRNARAWSRFATAFLVLTFAVFVLYVNIGERWTIRAHSFHFTAGTEYTHAALELRAREPGRDDVFLFRKLGGDADNVWTRESRSPRIVMLNLLYILTVSLLTGCIVMASTACSISRAQQDPSNQSEGG